MRLIVVDTGRRIAPFGDAVGDTPVGPGTLAAHQAWLAGQGGMQLVRAPGFDDVDTAGGPALVIADHTFLSARLVRGFLATVSGLSEPARLTLPKSRFVELYGQHQDLAIDADGSASYDAWWLPAGKNAAARSSARPVIAPFREKLIRFPVPKNILGRDDFAHPLTTSIALHVKHWVQVLWVNNLWPQVALVENITRRPLSTAWRLLRGLRPSLRSTFWALARSFSYAGRNVDIHPTACVEGSIIGEGCRVGPFALVRGSVLGRDVHVEERANVCYSVLGDRDFVSKNSTVVGCVGYPDADLCINGMQYCVAGRGSALTSFVRPMDLKYRDDVSVRADGKSLAIKELLVGTCFGHGCFVGPDVLIAPGREIPNRTIISPQPGAVLARVDPSLKDGGLAYVLDGTLRPFPSDER